MKTIENVVFKGGGVLGTAYVGAFNALQESMLAGKNGNRPLGCIKRVAGTSAGSIFGTMIALGLSAEEVAAEQASMNYATFVDIDPNFIAHEGLCFGVQFLNWMKALVKKYLNKNPGDPDPTFTDLWNLSQSNTCYKDLHVYSYNADAGKLYEFSYQTTPDVPIAEAVRASMSIPFFFQPWKFTGNLAVKYPGKFIDGGVMYNYPISTFDSDGVNHRTIGFYLDNMCYGTESIYALIIHWFLYKINCGETIETIIEGIINIVTDIERLNQKTDFVPEKLLNLLNDEKLCTNSSTDLLKKLLDKNLTTDQKLSLLTNEFKDMGNFSDFINTLKNYGQIIAASIHLPTNMRFSQDAPRTVFVDNLGFSFADFWMPQCNKNKLIDSGYNCTKEYLQYIMF
jgi:NTE family protein